MARFVYPLGQRGRVIGTPYAGTHRLGNWQSDNAVDIAVPTGTPVYAVTGGLISKVTLHPQDGGRFAGDQVTLSGRNSFFYTHLSQTLVKAGQRVRQGALIGYSGSANGVEHLHFGQRSGSPLSLMAAMIPKGGGGNAGALGRFESTSYGPPWGGIQGTGVTANGTDLTHGRKIYGIAVDPSVIPLGSKVYVQPNPFGHKGTFIAFDTGGAIKGKRIDFYDWRGRRRQNRWGRRPVTVTMAGGGGGDPGAPGRVRPGGEPAGEDTGHPETVLASWFGGPSIVKPPGADAAKDAAAGAAGAVKSSVDFFKWIAWIFHPRNILRVVEFMVGFPIVILGIFILMQEWRGADSEAPMRLLGDAVSMTPPGRALRVFKGKRSGRQLARSETRRRETAQATKQGRRKETERQGRKQLSRESRKIKKEDIPF